MTEQSSQLTLQIEVEPNKNVVPAELDNLTRSLLGEIEQDVQVSSVDVKSEVAPANTRSQEAITIGVLTITLLPVFVDKLIDLLISWVERNNDPKVTIIIPKEKGQVTVEYNPQKSNRKEVKKIIREALSTVKAGENR
jgi:hypothetical protein